MYVYIYIIFYYTRIVYVLYEYIYGICIENKEKLYKNIYRYYTYIYLDDDAIYICYNSSILKINNAI